MGHFEKFVSLRDTWNCNFLRGDFVIPVQPYTIMTITITNPNDLPKVLTFLSEFPSVEIKLNKAERKALDHNYGASGKVKTDDGSSEKIVYSKRLLESLKNANEGNVITFKSLDEVDAYFGL